MIDENALNIYTDGSCYYSPRRGGIGILYVWANAEGNEESEPFASIGYRGATNNKMELQACVIALRECRPYMQKGPFQRVVIHLDSRYVIDNYNTAKYNWQKQKWLNINGKPVANADIWKDLLRAVQKLKIPVIFKWVKGHRNKHNKIVDKMAKRSAKSFLNDPLSIVTVRRKITEKKTELGSVRMEKQRITIRIISSEYMKKQRTNAYRYEVMSRKSPYYGNADLLYSKEILKSGHTYYVKFNGDKTSPTITKVYREVNKKVK